MAKSPQWIPMLALAATLVSAVGVSAVTYGIMQNRIETLIRDYDVLKNEGDQSRTVLHRRITGALEEISRLKTSALERVTDVEVKITKLDSKIDGYSREAQASRSAAQATMNAILERLQRDMQ